MDTTELAGKLYKAGIIRFYESNPFYFLMTATTVLDNNSELLNRVESMLGIALINKDKKVLPCFNMDNLKNFSYDIIEGLLDNLCELIVDNTTTRNNTSSIRNNTNEILDIYEENRKIETIHLKKKAIQLLPSFILSMSAETRQANELIILSLNNIINKPPVNGSGIKATEIVISFIDDYLKTTTIDIEATFLPIAEYLKKHLDYINRENDLDNLDLTSISNSSSETHKVRLSIKELLASRLNKAA